MHRFYRVIRIVHIVFYILLSLFHVFETTFYIARNSELINRLTNNTQPGIIHGQAPPEGILGDTLLFGVIFLVFGMVGRVVVHALLGSLYGMVLTPDKVFRMPRAGFWICSCSLLIYLTWAGFTYLIGYLLGIQGDTPFVTFEDGYAASVYGIGVILLSITLFVGINYLGHRLLRLLRFTYRSLFTPQS